MLKVLDVDGAVHRVRGGWLATGQEWSYDAERYAKVDAVRRTEQQAMLGYQSTTGCRLRYLREQLDDLDATDCGRCDNCTGVSVDATVAAAAVDAAGAALTRPGVAIEPRKMWPTAMTTLGIDLRGRIAAGEVAETGRVIARFTDLGYGQQVRSLLTESAPDGPLPDNLESAVIAVLKSWDWAQRPVAVIRVGSHRRPQLVADLASRIARLGRLTDLGVLPHLRASSSYRSNGAQRLSAVHDGYELPPPIAESLSAEFAGSPILLVDDYTDTGWTFAELARVLRRAGAGAVLPFALGQSA
jgi:ATP-dependent DNA helicase RecQ